MEHRGLERAYGMTDNPSVFCNGTPCGLPYFFNGASALFDLLHAVPGNVLYLLSGSQPQEVQLLTTGVLPDNIYACLDEDKERVNCGADWLWGDKSTQKAIHAKHRTSPQESKNKAIVRKIKIEPN